MFSSSSIVLLLTMLLFFHQSEQHAKNVVIITDMEPDDHVAIALVLANKQLRERVLFIGTSLFNAKLKAELVKFQLDGDTSIPVYVGTEKQPEECPELESLEPAKQFALEEKKKNAVAMKDETSVKRKHNELQTELQKALQVAYNGGEQLEIVLLTASTDLMAILSGHPHLTAAIAKVHAMGGWIDVDKEETAASSAPQHNTQTVPLRTTFNWSVDPKASAAMVSSASEGKFPLLLYSSHAIKPALGASVNESVFNGCYEPLIKMIMGSKVPAAIKTMHSPALFCIFSLLPQLISVGGMKAIGSGIQLNSAVKQSTLGPISIAPLLSANPRVKPVQTGNGGQKVFSSSGNLPFKGDISKLSSSSSLRASRKEIEPILENNQQPFHAKKSNSKIDEKKVAERIEKFMDGLKEGFFTVNDSLDVHYVTGGDAASENVILFVHGFPENSFAWRHQMQHFRTNSIVYAIDLVGFGKSSKPHDSLEYTVDEHVEDIAKVVEKLKAEHKGKKITLVSHDIGAVIGCGFNYKYPKMVDRFVMMNAPNPKSIHHMRETGTLDIGKLLKTHYIHKLFGFLLFPIPSLQMQHNDFEFLDELYIRDKNTKVVNIDGKTFDEVDLEVYKQTFRQPGAANSALNFFRAPGAKAIHGIEEKVHDYFSSIGHWWAKKPSGGVKKEETAKLTKKIETKTLIIWGMDDTVFGVEFANGAKHECEHAKLIKLEHCSHWVQQDRPDDVNSHIGKFIKGDYDHELN